MSFPRLVIIGAGPTGLGAAYRLQELGYPSWVIYEQHDYVGGHASSCIDPQGFTWDEGGHVLFSHYPYFDRLIERVLGDDYYEHMRESWIRLYDRWIPYPFQNNIRYLSREVVLECLSGLTEVALNHHPPPQNFYEWILQTFGDGIAHHFMLPYNRKVWSHGLERMSYQWFGDRVSVVDFKRVLRNVILEQDDVGWGPNRTFKFPKRGATGEIYRRMIPYVKEHLLLSKRLSQVDLSAKTVTFADGTKDRYDALIYSGALDRLFEMARPLPKRMQEAARSLVHNSLYIVGIGLERPNPTSRCWLYFPEANSPFYRVTHFSHYSPFNVPSGDVDRYSSLMCESSCAARDPAWSKLPNEAVARRTVDGLLAVGLLEESDLSKIVTQHVIRVEYGYPIPTLDRDTTLAKLHPFLESHQIYSRGRFGGWRYEIGNMDHSVMQGVEVVDRLLNGAKETVWQSS